MMRTQLSCACGEVHLAVHGDPIITTECHCNSCRSAGERLGALPGAPDFLSDNGGTPFVLYRKDRVDIPSGAEYLKAFRLTPKSVTRRVIATCCNTPVFLEFKGGHWMSIYARIWPPNIMPGIEVRTMTSDVPASVELDDAIPGGKWPTAMFYAKLLRAWVSMGFRSPDIRVNEEVEA